MEQRMWVNDREYHVIRLLGRGKGGYSYLVSDGTREYVLKQIHHEPCAYYQFGDKLGAELRDYERLCGVGIPMPVLLDVDRERERILKEYIPGETVFDLVCADKMKSTYLDQMKALCGQLYAAKINIDYFPTNFVVKDGRLYYIDYECNDYMEQWDFAHWGILYWSKTEAFCDYLRQQSKEAEKAK